MKEYFIEEARKRMDCEDPSHDFYHAMRVLANAEYIASVEGGDMDVIVPAALFHDLVVYPKNSPKSNDSAADSAIVARQILKDLYSEDKIIKVEEAIREHSFGNGITPINVESKIVQDADRLECTGAIAVMRTFCSSGQMGRPFYDVMDPFCKAREPDSFVYAIDFFYKRLLKVGEMMNTKTAKEMADQRITFLYGFLEQLQNEIIVEV